ncbi:DUF3224 domain-containing protein [Fundicoccus sp. Sow4_D5]|uniref:DUF3224 domain-containing protein n=1 Tax=unclassified Fundicoccus TaxID=2761543 RepID=UPI003F922314
MMIKLKSKVVNRMEHSVHTDVDGYPVRLVEYAYELDGPNCKGSAKVHHLIYEMEDTDSVPVLFRGFMKFEGEINQQKGCFLAHEDGAIHQGAVTAKGRIVDATEELLMLVGNYVFTQLLTEDEFELQFDIEL